MFGIGGTEWVVIGIVLLIAVGPQRLPKLIKTLVRTYRELRRATRELRASSGIDEIMRDEDLRELRRPLHVPPPKKPAPPPKPKRTVSFSERMREDPPEGVDLAEIRARAEDLSDEERERIKADKDAQVEREEAIIRAKEQAAGIAPERDPEEHARIVAEKEAAAGLAPVDPEEHARVVAEKEAAAAREDAIRAEKIAAAEEEPEEPLDPEEHARIVAEKEARAAEVDS